LLASGKVLLAGCHDSSNAFVADAELYDPATNLWSFGGTLGTARQAHAATLLPSGKVLVTGGQGGSNSAELYDPATNSWSPAASFVTARYIHTSTLLPSGKVLLAAGFGSDFIASAELYDPALNTWSPAGTLATARSGPTATLLPSGKVLVIGGGASGIALASAELYDPATNKWAPAGALANERFSHSATLLPSGKVLVAGGQNYTTYPPKAELYDPGLAPTAVRQPGLASVTASLLQTRALAATSAGSSTTAGGATVSTGFMPLLEGSSGNTNNSAGNATVFQVQRIDNEQMRFIVNDESVSLTDTTFTASTTALAGFPAGPVRVRVWVNGVPSAALYSRLIGCGVGDTLFCDGFEP